MKVTVELDERLLNEAMELAGVWTQRAAIELALRELLFRLHYDEVSLLVPSAGQQMNLKPAAKLQK